MGASATGWRRATALAAVAATLALPVPAFAHGVPAAEAPLPTAGAATAPPAAAAPASQPAPVGLLRGKSLQPGEPGYKSTAWAATWSLGTTLLPVILGGFLMRSVQAGVMWTGLGMIASAQSFGPSAGYWYAGERPRFTWYRLALSGIALAAAGYPLYAYTGRVDGYNKGAAAALVTIAVAAEAVTLVLAAWELTLLGAAVERHNERPVRPPASRPGRTRAALPAPFFVPGGGGAGLQGRF